MKLTKHQQRLIRHIKATGQKIQTTVDGRFFLPDGTSVGSRTVSSLCQKECLRPTGSDLLGNISAYELQGGGMRAISWMTAIFGWRVAS